MLSFWVCDLIFTYNTCSSDGATDDLQELAKYLTLNLQKAGLHMLEVPVSLSLESQLAHYDMVGVPYMVIVRPTALINGILTLRNRDTTLEVSLLLRLS